MKQLTTEHKEKLKELGLHYCTHYENLVRYNKSTCGRCKYATYPRQ